MARSPLCQRLLLACISLALVFLASQAPLAQRPTPDAPALLPMSQQIAIREAWLEQRHAALLPLMRKHDIAMWIVVNEEFHDDPLTAYIAPPRPYTGNRDYFVFVPTAAPLAMFQVRGKLVDLDERKLLWRESMPEKQNLVPIEGAWDQPPGYPALTKALRRAEHDAVMYLERHDPLREA